MNEMRLHTAGDLGTLARAFVAASASEGDPFARPLLLVPGAGVQRWLGQQVARASAADGEGVFAGFDVHRVGALERLLTGEGAVDGWEAERLVWAVLAAVGAGPAASSAGSVGPGGPAGSLEAAASGEQPNTPASLPFALVTRGTTAPPRPPH